MNSKGYLLILLFSGFCFAGSPQNYTGNPEIDVKKVAALKSTTLLVVVDNTESDAGKAIVNSFNKYWKFTSFKFIKTSDVAQNINKSNVSFFAFTVVGGYQKGKEIMVYSPGEHFDLARRENQFILLDNNAILGKAYYKNRNIIRNATCIFGILLGNSGVINVEDDIYTDVNFVDFLIPSLAETGIYQKGVWHKETQFDLYQTLNEDEKSIVSFIPFYIQRLEQHLDYIEQHRNLPVSKETDVKISWEYKGGTYSDAAKITSYDDGLQQIKAMKILIDSAISDEFGKKLLAKSLDISEDAVQLVSWGEIENAINKKDADVAVLYQQKLDFTADPGYVFWTTDGKRLIDYNFRHIERNSTLSFGFRKDDNFNSERNEIHLK